MTATSDRMRELPLGSFLASGLWAAAMLQGHPSEATLLFDRAQIVVDTGLPAGTARLAAAPEVGMAVTGSHDKLLRVWSLGEEPLPQATIHLPSGPGNLGKIFAVAMTDDGSKIAAAGWTKTDNDEFAIFIYDPSGGHVATIEDVPGVVLDLEFTSGDQVLAATFDDGHGMRLYSSARDWTEVRASERYSAESHGLAAAPDGRLATSDLSGQVRLYDAAGVLQHETRIQGKPADLAFSPDGLTLAVGSVSEDFVLLLDGRTLDSRTELAVPRGAEIGGVPVVAWSDDGEILYAAAQPASPSAAGHIIAWHDGGRGEATVINVSEDTLYGIEPLPDGRILALSSEPWIGIVDPDGSVQPQETVESISSKELTGLLATSANGQVVDFMVGSTAMRFDTTSLVLSPLEENDGITARPLVEGLANLKANEIRRHPTDSTRSAAIDPHGRGFVLGTDWHLKGYSNDGEVHWEQVAPAVTWAVNIAPESRMVVAAYGDGTIRWHDMLAEGKELLALHVIRSSGADAADSSYDWVLWTPEGIYDSSGGAHEHLFWQKRGKGEPMAVAYPASAIAGTHRPEVLKHVLPERGTDGALGPTDAEKLPRMLRRVDHGLTEHYRRRGDLHVLTIGVSDLGEQARTLALKYADDDALDMVRALRRSQTGLYRSVQALPMWDVDATSIAILNQLDAIADRLAQAASNDSGRDHLVLVHFSGHGVVEGERYYLLTYGADVEPNSLPSTALEFGYVVDKLRRISEYAQVLVLIDACRTASLGDPVPVKDHLGSRLDDRRVSVITSSAEGQPSWEKDELKNGAFTEVVLGGLTKRADSDHNRIIESSEFQDWISKEMSKENEGRQRPSLDGNFFRPLFFAAHELTQ